MVLTSSTVQSKVPKGSTVVTIKNLYLSCDPYTRACMSKPLHKSYTDAFVPGYLGSRRYYDEMDDPYGPKRDQRSHSGREHSRRRRESSFGDKHKHFKEAIN